MTIDIEFEIKEHEDRMKLMEILERNGYRTRFELKTNYIPNKRFIVVEDMEYGNGVAK